MGYLFWWTVAVLAIIAVPFALPAIKGRFDPLAASWQVIEFSFVTDAENWSGGEYYVNHHPSGTEIWVASGANYIEVNGVKPSLLWQRRLWEAYRHWKASGAATRIVRSMGSKTAPPKLTVVQGAGGGAAAWTATIPAATNNDIG